MAARFPLILPCLIPHSRYQALTRTLGVRHPQFTGTNWASEKPSNLLSAIFFKAPDWPQFCHPWPPAQCTGVSNSRLTSLLTNNLKRCASGTQKWKGRTLFWEKSSLDKLCEDGITLIWSIMNGGEGRHGCIRDFSCWAGWLWESHGYLSRMSNKLLDMWVWGSQYALSMMGLGQHLLRKEGWNSGAGWSLAGKYRPDLDHEGGSRSLCERSETQQLQAKISNELESLIVTPSL